METVAPAWHFTAQDWAIIITALFAGLPAVATFIISLRNRENAKKLDKLTADTTDQTTKLDAINENTNGITQKLVAVTARASFHEGVAAQKAEHQATLDAALKQDRRKDDIRAD